MSTDWINPKTVDSMADVLGLTLPDPDLPWQSLDDDQKAAWSEARGQAKYADKMDTGTGQRLLDALYSAAKRIVDTTAEGRIVDAGDWVNLGLAAGALDEYMSADHYSAWVTVVAVSVPKVLLRIPGWEVPNTDCSLTLREVVALYECRNYAEEG